MSTLLIEGGHRLEGRVAVEGNKNAALPLLAACLLTGDECVLRNVPRIGDVEVVQRLRGSVLLLGPLLARLGKAHIAPPGGDFPARRTISTHLEALFQMGARHAPGPDHVLEAPDGLRPASMYLYEASVTGT